MAWKGYTYQTTTRGRYHEIGAEDGKDVDKATDREDASGHDLVSENKAPERRWDARGTPPRSG